MTQQVKGKKQISKPIAYAEYIVSLLIFSTNGLLVAQMSLDTGQVVLFRTLIGGAIVTALVMLKGGFDKEAVRAEARPLIIAGAALGFNWVTLFAGYRLLNVSLATLIYYIGPMLALLLSPVFLGERLTKPKIAVAGVVAIGLILISGSITFLGMNIKGLTFAGLSAACYAVLILANKNVHRTGGMQTAAIELDVAFVVVLVCVLLTEGMPHPLASDIPYIIIIGAVNTGLAYYLYFAGVQNLSAQTVSLVSYVDPVSALILSGLVLHEVLTPLQFVGAVLIIGGAITGELLRE